MAFRGGGADSFMKVAMLPAQKGFRAVIPAASVQGNGVQYFCEAYDKAGAKLSSDGRDDSPNVILLQAAPRPTAAGGGSEATPLEASAQGAPVEAESAFAPRAHSLWVGVAVGAAYGWQPSVNLERRSDLSAGAGFAGGGLGYFAPEIGF